MDTFKQLAKIHMHGSICMCGAFNCQADSIPVLEKKRSHRIARHLLRRVDHLIMDAANEGLDLDFDIS